MELILNIYFAGFLATLGWTLFNNPRDLLVCLMVSLFWFITIPVTIFCVVLAYLTYGRGEQ